MTVERFGIIKFRGNEVTVVRPDLEHGRPALEFTVHGLDWAPFKGLAVCPKALVRRGQRGPGECTFRPYDR